MKRFLMVLLSCLLVPALSSAAVSQLSVQVSPGKALYAQGETLHVAASAVGTGLEYRFIFLPPQVGSAPVMATAWGTANSFDIVTGSVVTPAGDYRLRVAVREAANIDSRLFSTKTINIRTPGEIPQLGMDLVQSRYETAQQVLRDTLVDVIDHQGRDCCIEQSLAVRIISFSSNEELIKSLLNAAGELAPNGGPAFVPGAANSATGAIGVDVVSPPVAVDNWWGTQVVLHLPAFLDLPAESVTIAYDTVLSPEQMQAQRNLVLERYNLAVATTRESLLRVIRKQRSGRDVTSEFSHFQSGDDLIASVLNRSHERAPRSGPAFVEGAGVASTGSVGVEVTVAPAAMDNWWDTGITIFLPEFLGLAAESTTINYNTVLSDSEQQAERDLLVSRYNFAIAKAREALLTVIRRQGAGRDVTDLFYHFSSGDDFIGGLLRGAGTWAPRGGPAFRSGAADDYNGQIGIDVISPPADLDDWWGTAVTISLPAYRGLTAESVTISYNSVLSPAEEQVQRDRVTNRYNLAIRTVRKTFAEVRTALAAGTQPTHQFVALADGDSFIWDLLNSAASAPRGGPAFRAYFDGENTLTGAVGIVVDSAPATAEDWAGTTVSVSLPAFLGLTEQTTVIRFDD